MKGIGFKPMACLISIKYNISMGVTLDVPMPVQISVGTWESPHQSMPGRGLVLSNTVSQKYIFLFARSSIDRAFSFGLIKNMSNFITIHCVLVAPVSKK